METLIADEEGEFEEKNEMNTRYEYYRNQYNYFRRLSGYLTGCRHEMEQVREMIFNDIQ